MENKQTRSAIDELEMLLEREREALLNGDLDQLVEQLQAKELSIDTLTDAAASNDINLTELQSKVLRNQALLDSALEGIRSVVNRMNTLHRIRKSLDTYDESGRKTTIENMTERRMEKRA